MRTLLTKAIKLVTVLMVTLGLSAFVVASAHGSHNDRVDPLQFTPDAAAREAVVGPGAAAMSAVESIHGHSHHGLSHDHNVDLIGEQIGEVRHIALTAAPEDCAASVQRLTVFEIHIPPRG